MGDLLEITSGNDEQNCYMISSRALKFYVKGNGTAVIKFTSKPYEKYGIRITIRKRCSCKYCDNTVETLNTISEHTYKLFWISWYGNKIRIGKGDNPKPFLEEKKLLDTINCISFLSLGDNTLYWKFRLPPKIKETVYRNISHGELKWVKMDGNCLPEDALIGGYENGFLYIMRAMHEYALIPGKFVPSKTAGYVTWGYEAHKKTDMEIVCGYDGIWTQTRDDEIPQGALEGGYSEVDHETLYAGRAIYDGYLIPGKVQPSHKILCGYDGIWISNEKDKIPSGAVLVGYTDCGETMFVGRTLHNGSVIPGNIATSRKVCYIPYNGKEISKTKYEFLVTPNISNES